MKSSYKQRKVEKRATKILARISLCNCYLKDTGDEVQEKQYHDPFCKVWKDEKGNIS